MPPPANAWPFTAATVIAGKASMRAKSACTVPRKGCARSGPSAIIQSRSRPFEHRLQDAIKQANRKKRGGDLRQVEVGSSGFGGASLWEHSWISIFRVFAAFLASCLTAIPIGLAMGMSRIFRGIFDPPIEFYRPIPPLAYLPLIIIWFGIGESAKILLIYLACFAPMALSTRAGVRSVSIEQIHAAYSLGATHSQVIRYVILPAALPEILTGMRIGIGFGWTTLVAAEMVAAAAGLGYMILNASEFLVTDVVVMGIIVIGLIALLSDLLMRTIERKLVPWKGKV